MAMPHAPDHPPRRPPPLDAAALEALALAYAARFATSAARLAAYLERKLAARGAAEGLPEDAIEAVVGKLVALNYVDDAAFAEARAGGLLRRGYGARRIGAALAQAGVAASLRAASLPDAAAARRAALAFAIKRGLGPFGAARPDRAQAQKQIAVLLRAGHDFATARALVGAPTPAAAEEWVAED